MATTPRAAGIYGRLSYAPDGSLEKVERQEADCRLLGGRLGWPISEAHIFLDNNRSAWQRNRKRPGWDAMLAAIDAGEIGGVLIYHGDRLIRQPWDLEKLLSISDSKGVRLASPSGTRDLDNPDDRFILRIEVAQACRESDNTSRRVKRGLAERARRGRAGSGGRRPFGFESDGETRREDECAILAGAVDRLLAGQSKAGVLRWMDSVSTTPLGNPWEGRSLNRMLEAPRIAGLVRHDGQLYRAVWEPIISVEAWEDVKLLLWQRALDNPYPGRERRHLLSGVAVCPSGHRLSTKLSGQANLRVYYCRERGCPTPVGRNITHLDAYVSGVVVGLLGDEGFMAELDAADPSVSGEIAELERRKRLAAQQLEDLVDHPDVDAGVLARSLAGFERKIRELRERAETSERRRLLRRVAGISREAWDDLPVDVRSSVVAATFRVTVLPTSQRGPGFDVSAVDMVRLPLD